jgi:AmmeMemoRadiSam system protein A
MKKTCKSEGNMNAELQQILLQIARQAILQTLEGHCVSAQDVFQSVEECRGFFPKPGKKEQAAMQGVPGLGTLPEELMELRATFVTLTMGGQLRGCIGMLEACRPLAEDVAANAVAAAFEDPRFPPLTKREFESLEIHISVLSPTEELRFSSEEDALHQIRPGIDGLILQDGFYRGTFLPSVWEELPQKALFWAHLKQKAGLPVDYWSETLRVFRYTTECFPV